VQVSFLKNYVKINLPRLLYYCESNILNILDSQVTVVVSHHNEGLQSVRLFVIAGILAEEEISCLKPGTQSHGTDLEHIGCGYKVPGMIFLQAYPMLATY
jgi:hypothetical protein